MQDMTVQSLTQNLHNIGILDRKEPADSGVGVDVGGSVLDHFVSGSGSKPLI